MEIQRAARCNNEARSRAPVRQGVAMGRLSNLFLSTRKESARVTDVRMAGSTDFVAIGQLFLP